MNDSRLRLLLKFSLFICWTLSVTAVFLVSSRNQINIQRVHKIQYSSISGFSNFYGTRNRSSHFHDTRVVPISAYFDPRPQHSHENATVILMSVERSLKNSIVGCEVDGARSNKSHVEEIPIMGWVHDHFTLTHTDCAVYCWDMNVTEGSVVKLMWKDNNKTHISTVRTPNVVFSHGPEKNEVMVCTTGFGGPIPHLDEWLTYQQTIGIKFIHLNVEESFMQNLNSSSLLRNLVYEGKVHIVQWKEYLTTSQVYYYSQNLKYLDCIFRYLNTYRYMMMIDFDEYFMPTGKRKDIKLYVTGVLKEKNIGSIHIPTIVYPCRSKVINRTTDIVDGNITKLYDTDKYIFTPNLGKSIHVVRTIKMINPHCADGFLPPFKKVIVCNTPAKCRTNSYVAHFSNYEQYRSHCKGSFFQQIIQKILHPFSKI